MCMLITLLRTYWTPQLSFLCLANFHFGKAYLGTCHFPFAFSVDCFAPSPPIDNIWAMMVCLEVRGEIIRTVPCCVLKLRTVISTLRWTVLTVLWIGFCHTGPISLCVDSYVCVFLSTAYVLYYCNTVRWTWWDWSLILSALTLLVWSFWPLKTCRRYDL